MPKTQVSDWDTVAANNTDINSIPIDGAVTTPSQVDNINREMMAQIKAFYLTTVQTITPTVDNTVPRFNGVAGAIQTSTVVINDDGSVAIAGTIAGPMLTLESTEAGVNSGPDINTDRLSPSPAVSDVLAAWRIRGKDSGGNTEVYALQYGQIIDPTNGSEDGLWGWQTVIAGTVATRMSLGAGLYMTGATGGDPGSGKMNAAGFQKNGSEFGNDVADQTITGGARITSLSLGTITTGTVTPDPGDRPMQHYTNGGAHTLAPGSNAGFYTLDITNNASAGAITTSGWTKVTGSSFTTTNGNKFRCSCSIGAGGSLLTVQALQ